VKPEADIAQPYDCVVDEKDIRVLAGDWLLSDEYITSVAPKDPNLLLHWAFDEGSGTTANDSAGVVDGVISGASYVDTTPDGSAYCLDFDGGGDYVYVVDGNDANNLLSGLGAITVSIWIKSDETGTDSGFIIFQEPAGSDNRNIRYDADGGEGDLNLIKYGVTTGVDDREEDESSSDVQTTNWQHIVVTWESGVGLKLYINGVLDIPEENADPFTGTLTGYNRIIVGKGCKDTASNQGWDGLIDDVRIYDYALSKEEAAYLATNGGAGIHIPIPSPANVYNKEPEGSQWINLKDYSLITGSWLEEMLWPSD
jgi:hypothetical protein